MAKARPVLLEPVLAVDIAVPVGCDRPGDAAGVRPARPDPRLRPAVRLGRLGRRAGAGAGGGDGRADRGAAFATAGVGSFTQRFDHLAELNGKAAEQVVTERKRRLAA